MTAPPTPVPADMTHPAPAPTTGPPAGLQVIVTRPAAQAPAWVQALRDAGLQAQALPLIAIAPPADVQPVHAAWRALPEQALVMFVSANAVEHFFAACPGGEPAWPAGVMAAAAGPGTAASLRKAGVPASQVISPADDAPAFDTEALWALLAHLPWQGRQVQVVRGDGGRDWLADTLRRHGAQVGFVPAYRRMLPQPGAAERALLARAQAAPASHLWLFSSSEAVVHLQTLAPGADWRAAPALATHPRIAQAARAAGFGQVQEVAPQRAAVVAAARDAARRSVNTAAAATSDQRSARRRPGLNPPVGRFPAPSERRR
jgi:uroporphyrinogen-III synthase